jgi:hypothetical protein
MSLKSQNGFQMYIIIGIDPPLYCNQTLEILFLNQSIEKRLGFTAKEAKMAKHDPVKGQQIAQKLTDFYKELKDLETVFELRIGQGCIEWYIESV